MRMIMAFGALMVLVAASALAQDAAPPSKRPITDTTIINTCGERLFKMFARYGTPDDVRALRGDTAAQDEVLCDYGAYGFRVRDKLVRTCFFWSDWKAPVRGIKIGDSRQQVEKVLGAATITSKDKDGVLTAYGYSLNDLGADFFVNFDKDGKVWRVEVSMK